jgi:DNA replication and repair protein RecF
MGLHGAALVAARNECLSELGARLESAPDGPFARAALALEGWSESDDFARLLAKSRARDAAAGRTIEGPHRIDLVVIHREKSQPASRCSTGEQKALLLGIILAHAECVKERQQRPPLLLLDEVAAHLDPVRRQALFERLASTGGQVWMTGTEAAPFAAVISSASHFHLKS